MSLLPLHERLRPVKNDAAIIFYSRGIFRLIHDLSKEVTWSEQEEAIFTMLVDKFHEIVSNGSMRYFIIGGIVVM